MIRNLKVLFAAAMALAAFGAFSSSAHAAEELFHCTVAPCTATLAADETAGTTTAHHVFVVKGKTAGGTESSFSITCPQLTGQATLSTQTATEATVTNLKYENAKSEARCVFFGSESLEINFTSCDYKVQSLNGSKSTAQVHVLCSTAGDAIDLSIKGTLCFQITPFTSTGLGYHDSLIGGVKKVVTATANVAVPGAAVDLKNVGSANCAVFGLSSVTAATYTTGNTLVKTETEAGVVAGGWFE